MTTSLKLREPVAVSTPVSYSFRFENMGWAIFTINDATGEFNIQSDWGNYSYRWHIYSLGKKRDGSYKRLTDFLLDANNDYIVRKFAYENKHDLGDVIDEEETRKFLKQHIIEDRRSRAISNYQARDLWDDVDNWDLTGSIDSACALCPEGLASYLGEFWDYVQTKKNPRFGFIRDTLLPFFFKWLRWHLTNGDAPFPETTIEKV